jgi:hypothetical protein
MSRRLRRIWLAATAALLLLPAATVAQQTYRITLKEPDKGEPALCRRIARFRTQATINQSKSKETLLSEEKSHDLTFRQEVLEKPDGSSKARKLRRHYLRAEQTRNGMTKTLAYAGKVISIEERDGRYRFRNDKGENVTTAHDLESECNLTNPLPALPPFGPDWLPRTRAVKVGESWKIEPASFARPLDTLTPLRIAPGKITATGKLLRVYRKGARQYGVLELRIEIPVVKALPFATEEKLDLKASKFLIRIVADACIDGSGFDYHLKGTLEGTIEAVMEDGGQQARVGWRFLGDLFESREVAVKE